MPICGYCEEVVFSQPLSSATGEDPPITGSPATDTFNNNMAKPIIWSLFLENSRLQETGIDKRCSFTWLVCTSGRFSTSYAFLLKISGGGCQETASYCQEKYTNRTAKSPEVKPTQGGFHLLSLLRSGIYWYQMLHSYNQQDAFYSLLRQLSSRGKRGNSSHHKHGNLSGLSFNATSISRMVIKLSLDSPTGSLRGRDDCYL